MYHCYGRKAGNGEALEKLLKEYAGEHPKTERWNVYVELDVPLQATVVRSGTKEEVILTSGGQSVTLVRQTIFQEHGELNVSCEPEGKEVPVDTLNLHFRNIDDPETDRGLVWVAPGTPAQAAFTVNRRALDTPGLVKNIAEAAFRAVEQKVLKHFVQTT